jgi:hypothetical protein
VAVVNRGGVGGGVERPHLSRRTCYGGNMVKGWGGTFQKINIPVKQK